MTIKRLLSLVLLSVLSLAGYWVWLGSENRTQMVGALALASMALVGVFCYHRIQGERRWRNALDAYAERALAQHLSRKRPRVSVAPRP
jgi:hypothetical protein